MSEVMLAIRGLLHRLITSLSPEPSPWEGSNRLQNDFLNFEDFDDDELNLLATFLSSSPVSPEEALTANDDGNLFASSSSFDDKCDADDRSPYPRPNVTTYPLKAPIHTFNLEDASEDAQVLFTKLYNNDHCQSAESFREQVFLPVEYMHSESYRIPYNQIGILFGISKGAVTQHYQRMNTKLKKLEGLYLLRRQTGTGSASSYTSGSEAAIPPQQMICCTF
jgi:hypothetical protein